MDNININAFYDFDFCITIKSIEHLLKEIIKVKQFSLTCCLRGCDRKTTLEIFKKYLKSKNYVATNYTDHQGPMLMIYKY